MSALATAGLRTRVSTTARADTGVAVVGVPALIALVFSLAFSWRPSFWIDETSTVSATRRPLSSLPHLVEHQDAVHAFYYLLLHPWVQASTDAWWVRLPSALAIAGTAGLVATLGWQLAGRRTGLAAGLVFAVLPISSYYGAEARGYALAMMFVAGSTVALVRATRDSRWQTWSIYGALVTLSGWVFLIAVLSVAAHLAYVLVAHRTRDRLTGFAISALCAGVLVLPVAIGGATETQQVYWIPAVTAGTVTGAWKTWFAGSTVLGLIVWALAVTAVVLALVGRRRRRHDGGLVLLGGGLALLPAVLLLAGSVAHPFWSARYVSYSVIGFALLAGYVLARVPWRSVLVAGVVVLLLAGTPQQIAQRRTNGKGDQQASLAAVLQADRRPGDAVVFTRAPWRTSAAAYPSAFGGLDDIDLARTPAEAGSFTGDPVSTADLLTRARGAQRIWWWHETRSRPTPADTRQLETLAGAGWRVVEHHGAEGTTLDLMTRG